MFYCSLQEAQVHEIMLETKSLKFGRWSLLLQKGISGIFSMNAHFFLLSRGAIYLQHLPRQVTRQKHQILRLPRQATTPSTPLLYATLLWASLVLGSFSSSTPLLYTALLLDSSSSSTVFVVIFQGPNVESLSTQHRLISKVFISLRNRSVYLHRLILTITIICIYTEYTNATVCTNL